MAFPYIFEENFESGTRGNFTSETDPGSGLSFVSEREMGEVYPALGCYAMKVELDKLVHGSMYVASTAFATSANVTRFARFPVYVPSNVQAQSNESAVVLLNLVNSTGGREAAVCLARRDPDGVVFTLNGTVDPYGYIKPRLDDWNWIEVTWTVANSPTENGESSMWINGSKIWNTDTAEAAITEGRFGAGLLSGAWTGCLYFDHIVCDEDRLYLPAVTRKNVAGHTSLFTQSGFVFCGSGSITSVQSLDTGGMQDARVRIYDTDNPSRIVESDKRVDRKWDEYAPMVPTSFERGAYVLLSGTTPQALVAVGSVHGGVAEVPFGAEASEPVFDAGVFEEGVFE